MNACEVCGRCDLIFPSVSTSSHTSPTFVEVVVPLALPKTLTYKWFSSAEEPQVGTRVVVPLGHKKWTGVLWEVHQTPPEGYVAKEVEAVVDDAPVITEAQRDMFTWWALGARGTRSGGSAGRPGSCAPRAECHTARTTWRGRIACIGKPVRSRGGFETG